MLDIMFMLYYIVFYFTQSSWTSVRCLNIIFCYFCKNDIVFGIIILSWRMKLRFTVCIRSMFYDFNNCTLSSSTGKHFYNLNDVLGGWFVINPSGCVGLYTCDKRIKNKTIYSWNISYFSVRNNNICEKFSQIL